MKMTSFRVENYRSILDSGWVEVDDIAVIVGKNESGKTSLLKALWKFNPYKKEPYQLDREWPRGRRKERSETKTVVTVRFEFNNAERTELEAIDASTKGITGAEIQRDYKGTYSYSFLPHQPDRDHKMKWVISVIEENLQKLENDPSAHFRGQYEGALTNLIKEVRKQGGTNTAVAQLQALKGQLQSFVQQGTDRQVAQAMSQQVDKAVQELNQKPPLQKAVDTTHKWLPTFIYMDDYKIFSGSAQLDQIKQRKDREQLTEGDSTVIAIMEMAGLDLEEEVKKGNQQDREQRILDMNDASQTLTQEIANRWTQKKYEVMFQADGQHFITFVKDVDSKILVPLEERSKGFQWFFSFDMTFLYETDGQFKNAIILLDEPGLHLHAAAQRDLLTRIKAYARNNQLIYSTHLPFMIDFTRLDNIYVAEEGPGKGAIIHKNWATADKDARFTLQAALGLSWSQSLFVGQYNLVVEGVTDFWFLTTFSAMLQEAGKDGYDEQLVITPAGGATKVAYVGTILHGQQLNVAVLLDSDKEGQTAYEQLVHQWIMEAKHVLKLGDIVGSGGTMTLEDLFSEQYYLQHVNAAYSKELNGKSLSLPSEPDKSLLERVEKALRDKGVDKFNKGRVAKRIMSDLAKKKASDIPPETISKFEQVFAALNSIVATWKTV